MAPVRPKPGGSPAKTAGSPAKEAGSGEKESGKVSKENPSANWAFSMGYDGPAQKPAFFRRRSPGAAPRGGAFGDSDHSIRGSDNRKTKSRSYRRCAGSSWMAGLGPRRFRFDFSGQNIGIDLGPFPEFGDSLDMKGISAVPHTNTVFRDILNCCPGLPLTGFWRSTGPTVWCAVSRPSGSCWRCVWSIVGGVFAARHRSLDVEPSGAALSCGGAAPARSTLPTPTAAAIPGFSGAFHSYAGDDDTWPRHKMGDTVRLMDSTGLGLAAQAPSGRAFRPAGGPEADVVYGPDLGCPIPHDHRATVNDIVAARTMPIETGATYVLTWAITTMAGGPRSTRRIAASSRGSDRRSFRLNPCPSSRPRGRAIGSASCRADRPRAAEIPCKARCARSS